MNTITDTEILKTILTKSSKSVYSIKKELEREYSKLTKSSKSDYSIKKELERKIDKKKVNYPTLLRRINKLKDNAFIKIEKGLRKNGKVDRRDTKNLDLTHKGLFKLILDGNLSDADIRLLIEKTYLKRSLKKIELANLSLVKTVQINTIRESFRTLRPMINLDHYDEKHALSLFYDTVSQFLLTELMNKMKDIPDLQVKQKSKRKQAYKFLKSLKPEDKELIFSLYDSLKKQKYDLEKKLKLLTQTVAHLHGLNGNEKRVNKISFR